MGRERLHYRTAQLSSVLSVTKSGLKSLARRRPSPGLEVTAESERRLNLVQLYFISVLVTINSGEEKTVLWS